jgi:opacity protein-like surface antigen
MKMKRLLLIVLLAGAILSTALVAGCASTKIGDILDDFPQYEGKEVVVKGTVGETIWFALLERGAFQVGDGSGNIWVITSQPPPQENEEVTITGTAQASFQLGDRSLGKVIVETDRK